MQNPLVNVTIAAVINSALVYLQWRIVGLYINSLEAYKIAAIINFFISTVAFIVSVWLLFNFDTAIAALILFVATVGWQLILYTEKFKDLIEDDKVNLIMAKINKRLSEE